jgi:hypothetical protein
MWHPPGSSDDNGARISQGPSPKLQGNSKPRTVVDLARVGQGRDQGYRIYNAEFRIQNPLPLPLVRYRFEPL